MNNYAWATLATSQDYIKGAILLYKRMQYVKSKYPVIIMVTDNITDFSLFKEFNVPYQIIARYQFTKLSWERTIYQDTINKFQIFNLIKYDKIFFIDADIFIFKNIDQLFEDRAQNNLATFWYREGTYEKERSVCGESFIVKPNINLWRFILKNFQNYCNNDEQVINILFFNYIIPSKVKDYLTNSDYAFHNAGENKILNKITKENFYQILKINDKNEFNKNFF